MNSSKYKYVIATFLQLATTLCVHAQVWQWSAPVISVVSPETYDHPRAFLWIPENCKQVRAVVVGQHNMIEEGIFEDRSFRKTMQDLGFAVVWVSPIFNITFNFNTGADEEFEGMMQSLANISGYNELAYAPVVPVGHSALASYPWNFTAWNPERTLAAISIHGDAPLTHLTGSGRPNPDWGKRAIDGVPGLFIMGEFEWWEKRVEPGWDYVQQHPEAPITFFADAGHGHFDYSDDMIGYINLFLRKAAKYRLPAKTKGKGQGKLKTISPGNGWLIDRWRKDSLPQAISAAYGEFNGDKPVASWVFDAEMARATEDYYAKARGKSEQYMGILQNGAMIKPTGGHAQFSIPFTPVDDGKTVHLSAFFADSSKIVPAESHASTPIVISRITGPVKKINDTTFQINFYRMGFNNPKRSNDIWLLASNKGDEKYKSVVQQVNIKFPLINKEGREQEIIFPAITSVVNGIKKLKLEAFSSAGRPVSFYVKEGPAVVEGNELHFTSIPPRAKYPVKVTVVAWQYGSSLEPKLKSAEPVERSFFITR